MKYENVNFANTVGIINYTLDKGVSSLHPQFGMNLEKQIYALT